MGAQPRISAHSALGVFVGMVYATMISLVIYYAKEEGLFSKLTVAFFLLPLFLFFAHDWIARGIVNQLFDPDTQTASIRLFVKLALDIAVVYSLLLTALELVELLGAMSLDAAVAHKDFVVRLGAFSIISGFWNLAIVMALLPGRRLKILSLRVPSDLVSQYFPKIRDWQERMREEFDGLDSPSGSVLSGRDIGAHLRAVGLILVKGPRAFYWLFLPYALLVKVLLLDVMLGVVIILNAESGALEDHSPLWCLALLGLSICLYSWHVSPRPTTGPWFERMCAVVMAVFALSLYTIMSPMLLAITLVAQQVVAGQIMLKHFEPVTSSPSAAAIEHSE